MKIKREWFLPLMYSILLLIVGLLFFFMRNSADVLVNLLFSIVLIGSGLTSFYNVYNKEIESSRFKTITYVHIIVSLVLGVLFVILAFTANPAMLNTLLFILAIALGLNGLGGLYKTFVFYKLTKEFSFFSLIEALVLIVLSVVTIIYIKDIKTILSKIIAIVCIIGSISYFIKFKLNLSSSKKEAEYEKLN